MRRVVLAGVIAGLVGATDAGCAPSAAVRAEVSAPLPSRTLANPAVGAFYDALAAHGDWLHLPPYGLVWCPSETEVGVSFRPYVDGGHWRSTDVGWTFESDHPWGWAVFHYGRWFHDVAYGWLWRPDTTWAPAWVAWRTGAGYVGWAPLPPAGARRAVDWYSPAWAFVPTMCFGAPQVHRYLASEGSVEAAFPLTAAAAETVVIDGRRFATGPRPSFVAEYGGRSVATVHLVPPRPGVISAGGTPTGIGVAAPASGGRTLTP